MSILKNFIGLGFDSSKLLILRYFIIKSPIMFEKVLFSGTELSDFVRGNPTKAKRTSRGAFYKMVRFLKRLSD